MGILYDTGCAVEDKGVQDSSPRFTAPTLLAHSSSHRVLMPARAGKANGFTLIELLACVSVIAILAALILSVTGKMKMQGNKARGIANLRQIGAAVASFAGDNQGRLPGPAPLGIYPYYNRAGRNSNLIIGAQLATYLELPDAASLQTSANVRVPALEDPGFKDLLRDSTIAPNFVQNPVLSDQPGVAGKRHIFGIVASGSVVATPSMTLLEIAKLGGPSKVWMLMNMDQQLPSSVTMKSGWVSKLPPKPVYKDARMRLFVDAHVEMVPLDAPLQ